MSSKDNNIITTENLEENKQDSIPKYTIIICMGWLMFFHFGGYFGGIINGRFGFDYHYFYTDVKAFWSGGETYQYGFYYLNYFYFLCFWMAFLPEFTGLIVHIIITEIFFLLILLNVENIYQKNWIYGNIIIVVWYSMTFNTNIWIAFSFFMYHKYRDKWYAPFFFLLAFYKPTTLIIATILYIENLIFEKKIRLDQFPAFAIVLTIVTISYLTSTGLNRNLNNATDMTLYFQLAHFLWFSIPLMTFTEYKQYSRKSIWIFWSFYSLAQIIYGLIWLYGLGNSRWIDLPFALNLKTLNSLRSLLK